MGKGKKMITLREFKEKMHEAKEVLSRFRDDRLKQSIINLAKQKGLKVKDMGSKIEVSGNGRKVMDLTLAVQKQDVKVEQLEEGKSSTGYELYHRDFSSAMQHAYKHAKAKLGVDVDPEEIDSKVASGPRKPSKGKTNTYRLLDKGGKKAIQVQVYGMDNGKYELNMYKESVDVNEEMDPTDHVKEKDGKFCVYNKDGEVVAEFDNKKDADAYAIKNHDKLMEYVEVGTNAIRNTYAKATPGQTNELTGTDKAIAGAALGALGYGAKKAVDRFNPTKVRDARKKRMERDAEKRQAERDIAQMKRKKLQGSN